MYIKKTIGRFFPVVDSNRRKQMVIDSILLSPQKNEDVVNIHRFNPNNVGDFYCAPHHYFKELKNKSLDISGFRSVNKKKRENWIEKVNTNALIIGGGGLLNIRHFHKQMKLFEKLAEMGKKTVLWGLGHNETERNQFGKISHYKVDPDKFGLVGTRDYSMPAEWVPCVSCLHPIFDRTHETTHETGIVFSNKTLKNKQLIKKLNRYPFTSNTTNLNDMVSFIGSSETLVTDSYHAMYWAILMGKKTVAVPTTSKFYDFKYPTIITTYDDFEKDLKKARSYSGALEECREINLQFAEKVFDYLGM